MIAWCCLAMCVTRQECLNGAQQHTVLQIEARFEFLQKGIDSSVCLQLMQVLVRPLKPAAALLLPLDEAKKAVHCSVDSAKLLSCIGCHWQFQLPQKGLDSVCLHLLLVLVCPLKLAAALLRPSHVATQGAHCRVAKLPQLFRACSFVAILESHFRKILPPVCALQRLHALGVTVQARDRLKALESPIEGCQQPPQTWPTLCQGPCSQSCNHGWLVESLAAEGFRTERCVYGDGHQRVKLCLDGALLSGQSS
mmetsp:Transcript_31230/g.72491  ORF Transcript_31230/g.72491 Transcript_31230/m.72491 type:complete len:252 (+) Transcript_31230:114-869(+)